MPTVCRFTCTTQVEASTFDVFRGSTLSPAEHLTFRLHVGAALCYELDVETLSHAGQRFDNMRIGGNAEKAADQGDKNEQFPVH